MPSTTSVLLRHQSTRSRIQTAKSTSTKSPGRREPSWRRALPASRLRPCWLGYWRCLRKRRSIPARQTCDSAQTVMPASRVACESCYCVNTRQNTRRKQKTKGGRGEPLPMHVFHVIAKVCRMVHLVLEELGSQSACAILHHDTRKPTGEKKRGGGSKLTMPVTLLGTKLGTWFLLSDSNRK